jgi:hypothetical protein
MQRTWRAKRPPPHDQTDGRYAAQSCIWNTGVIAQRCSRHPYRIQLIPGSIHRCRRSAPWTDVQQTNRASASDDCRYQMTDRTTILYLDPFDGSEHAQITEYWAWVCENQDIPIVEYPHPPGWNGPPEPPRRSRHRLRRPNLRPTHVRFHSAKLTAMSRICSLLPVTDRIRTTSNLNGFIA